jgi:hypothetical protein
MTFERFLRGETVTHERGVKGLKSALRESGALFVRKSLRRSNQQDGHHFGSRVLDGDGRTRPLTVLELERWLRDERKTRSTYGKTTDE